MDWGEQMNMNFWKHALDNDHPSKMSTNSVDLYACMFFSLFVALYDRDIQSQVSKLRVSKANVQRVMCYSNDLDWK